MIAIIALEMWVNNGDHLSTNCGEIVLHLERVREDRLIPLFIGSVG